MNQPLDRGRYALVIALDAAMLLGHVHWMAPIYSLWLFTLLGLAAALARRRVRAASAWLRMPMLVATIGLLIYSAGSPIGREGGSALLGGLIVLKLFETTTRRDARVTAAAALFFCMIGFLFGQGLLLTAYQCLVALGCFLVMHTTSIGDEIDTYPALLGRIDRGARITMRVAMASIPSTKSMET